MSKIEKTQQLNYSIEQVWSAMTHQDSLSVWLMPNDFKPETGHVFTFQTQPAPGFDGIVHSKVLDIQPPHLLKLAWNTGNIKTTVTFKLVAQGGKTRLHLNHEGFSLTQLPVKLMLDQGWKKILGQKLPTYLHKHTHLTH